MVKEHECTQSQKIDNALKEAKEAIADSIKDRRQLSERQILLESNSNQLVKKLDNIEIKIDKIMAILWDLDDRYDNRYASKTVETGIVYALKIVWGAVLLAILAVIWLGNK